MDILYAWCSVHGNSVGFVLFPWNDKYAVFIYCYLGVSTHGLYNNIVQKVIKNLKLAFIETETDPLVGFTFRYLLYSIDKKLMLYLCCDIM